MVIEAPKPVIKEPKEIIKEEVFVEEVIADDYSLALSAVLDKTMAEDEVRGGIVYRYSGLAIDEQRRTGFPASVKLAQMIVEAGFSDRSPYGSKIFQEGMNPFGIKYWDSKEYPDYVIGYIKRGDDKFIKFRDVESAFQFHSDFVMTRKHYTRHLPDNYDYHDVLNALMKGGYAEEDHYRNLLASVIDRYDLHLLDELWADKTHKNCYYLS